MKAERARAMVIAFIICSTLLCITGWCMMVQKMWISTGVSFMFGSIFWCIATDIAKAIRDGECQ